MSKLRFFSFASRDELLTKVDACLWLTVVDIVTARKDDTMVFGIKDETEIEG